MDARAYDPAIARWTSIDPVAHHSMSTYNAFDNNPVYWADPSGADAKSGNLGAAIMGFEPITADMVGNSSFGASNISSSALSNNGNDDIITVNDKGEIISVKASEGNHIIVTQSGKRLFANDPAFDQDQIDYFVSLFIHFGNSHGSIKIFAIMDNKKVAEIFNNINIGKIKENFELATTLSLLSLPPMARELYLASLGPGSFDFVPQMSNFNFQEEVRGNSNDLIFPQDGNGGFIKFQNSNILYNIYDTGNFFTGKGFNLIGLGLKESLEGADLNSRLTGFGPDSAADQRALKNGFNFRGIRWEK